MSQELLYTSAPQGLKPGSRGFCTVISSSGVSTNLLTRLESLSAYRHVFPPGHPDAKKNPVCFSHLILNIGGQAVSVLSRISDYGVDYSQRTNKLAHHIVLDPTERTPAGPGWLMLQPTIMRTQWNGICEAPVNGPALPKGHQAAKVCQRWSAIMGDSGWGGVVADAFASTSGKPLWILFDVAQSAEILALINEAIRLLPVELRWRATFSTYATNVPPDADCKVRCVLRGTDEARLAAARGHTIDLGQPSQLTTTSRFILLARNGNDPHAPATKQIAAARTTRTTYSGPDLEIVDSDEASALPKTETRKPGGPPLPPAIKPKTNEAVFTRPLTRQSNKLQWALIATPGLIMMLLAIAVVLLFNQPDQVLSPRSDTENPLASGQLTSPDSNANTEETQTPSGETNKEDGEPKKVDEPVDKEKATDLVEVNPFEEKVPAGKPEDKAIEEPAKVEKALLGRIVESKLFEGLVWIELEIDLDEGLVGRRYRLDPRDDPRHFEGNSIEVRGSKNNLIRLGKVKSMQPPVLLFMMATSDPELEKVASELKKGWNELRSVLIGWNTADRSIRDRSESFGIKLPSEKNPMKQGFVETIEQVEAIIDRIKKEQSKNPTNQGYEQGLKQAQLILEHCQSMLKKLSALETDKVFHTGTLLYIETRQADGNLADQPLAVSYRIWEAAPKKEDQVEIKTDKEDSKASDDKVKTGEASTESGTLQGDGDKPKVDKDSKPANKGSPSALSHQ
jgi:GTPase-associated protein 1, N-terminal domain type 2/GTPase-associated protein 1, middle domain